VIGDYRDYPAGALMLDFALDMSLTYWNWELGGDNFLHHNNRCLQDAPATRAIDNFIEEAMNGGKFAHEAWSLRNISLSQLLFRAESIK